MSADNVIAIAQFEDGYRVAHTSMSTMLDLDNSVVHLTHKEREDLIKHIFGKCNLFQDVNDATNYANRLYEEQFFVEYGIQNFGKYSGNIFRKEVSNMREENYDKFWIVMGKLPTKITVRHDTKVSAENEALRLSKAYPGQEFIVMESVKGFVQTTAVTKYYNLEPVPF